MINRRGQPGDQCLGQGHLCRGWSHFLTEFGFTSIDSRVSGRSFCCNLPFTPKFISRSDWPASPMIGDWPPPLPPFVLFCDWTGAPRTHSPFSEVWWDCDLARRPVSSARSDSDLTGRLVCVVVYLFPEIIDPRQNSSQWSVCGRFSVALLHYSRNVRFWAWRYQSGMIRQHVSEGIFICE